MSHFLFHLWNHNQYGKRSLEDVIGIMGHQLRALGHTAIWDQSLEKIEKDGAFDIKFAEPIGKDGKRCYNVIVEGFNEDVIDVIAIAHSQGSRFICLATEEPTDKGFNHGISPEMIKRQEKFPLAARFFDGILHLVPGKRVTDWYGQFAPAFHCELGYAHSLIRKPTNKVPEYDFGFFGSVSPRRFKILKKLGRRSFNPKCVRIINRFPDQVTRDKLMQNVKVIVQLRLNDKMGLVSNSRCNTALHLGRPIVAEPHEYSKPWDEIVKFSTTTDNFYDMAYAVLAAWQPVHYSQFSKMKEKLTPEVCVGYAIREIERLRTQKAA